MADAIRGAAARGVTVRIAFNEDEPAEPFPPPPQTEPPILETLGVPFKGIPGRYDLMHHKFVVRDREAVWTGSTNWTLDSFEREENLIVTVGSRAIARAFHHTFDEIWRRGEVEDSGELEHPPVGVGDVHVRPWFCPGRGPKLAHRIAEAIGTARHRVRIASPVITSAPVLSTIAQRIGEGDLDLAGVVDATQVGQVLRQWEQQTPGSWKRPVLERIMGSGHFTGKPSTPWRPGAVHDYMHAKVTVADDTVFVGSYNLSRSGESNAENVLEIHGRELADRMARYIDAVRARYPLADVRP